jgi:hypothetical protein
MKSSDLETFETDPLLCRVKDAEWRYLSGNRAICNPEEENVMGTKSADIAWHVEAAALVRNDQDVLESGVPHFMNEVVSHSDRGPATLSVCEWVDELDGRRLVFGTSFVVPAL